MSRSRTYSAGNFLQPGYAIGLIAVFMSIVFMTLQSGCKPRELVKTTPQMSAEEQFWIRILLLSNVKECTLRIKVPFRAASIDPATGESDIWVRFDKRNEEVGVSLESGRIIIADRAFSADPALLYPESPHIFNLNGNDYRGRLKFIPNSDGKTFDVINLVPLEPYLAGVIAAEMPDYWEPEALKAQTIVARSYCLYIKNNFGKNRNWDLSRTQANQVYLGVKAESSQVWSAIDQTYGQILMTPDPGGTQMSFPTYYSSVCGGHTENSKNVFGDSFGPLCGVECPYCEDVARLGYFFWPMVQFDKKEVTAKLLDKYPTLKLLGDIVKIEATDESNYGKISRLTRIKLTGSTGKSDTLRAEDLRLTIDPTGRKIKSTICKIVSWDGTWAFLSGRGWGHGVGMCQCGAEGMARKGKTTKQILEYYYPGSKMVSIY